MLVTPDLVSVLRGITLGGSSAFFFGAAFPPPIEMLRRHGVDLRSDVADARAELRPAPIRDDMMTPMARRLSDAARQLGLDWIRLDKFMDQERWRPGSRFGYYGDAVGIRWSARRFVEDAVAAGATLITSARVDRVLTEGNHASGIEYVRDGAVHRAFADQVVLAAGGIGSPLLLRTAGIREAGFDYFFDPLITVAGTLRDVRLRDDEIPLSAGVLLEREGIMLADMPLPPAVHFMFTAQVLRLRSAVTFRSTARVMVKVRDELGGRLSAGGGIRKRLSSSDRDKLASGEALAKRILAAASATHIHTTARFAAHPGGTAKIGEVVDSKLRTKFENLYVCDCSVIPEALGVPPTLTLVALGKYVAREVAGAPQQLPQQSLSVSDQ
jgi:choline dehydrogenase-like flavoprotein